MSKKRNFITLSLIMIIVLMVGGVVSFAGSTDVYVTKAVVSDGTTLVKKGDVFNFEISITNKGTKVVDNVNLEISSDNFKFDDGEYSKAFAGGGDAGNIGTGGIWTINPKIRKIGTGNTITMVLTWKEDGTDVSYSSSRTVSIDEADESISTVTKDKPIIAILKEKEFGSLIAGDKLTLEIPLENRGKQAAYNLKSTVVGYNKDGIRLVNDINSKVIGGLSAGGEESIYYDIEVSPKAKSDTYELTVTNEYTDTNGNKYKADSKIYIPVEGKDSAAIELEVDNLNHNHVITAGNDMDITFDIKNNGIVDAEKVIVSIRYPGDFIPTSTPKQIIKNLNVGEVESLKFDFKSKTDSSTQYNDFFVVLDYYADATSDDTSKYEEYFGVMVEGKTSLGRPKIIVKNYAIEDADVAMAGQEFVMNVDLYNTSSSDEIKNIKVKMESDDGVFSPVDSSSSFFVEYLGRQETKTIPLKFKTKVDAGVKVYNITLTMEYEDGKGNAYDSQEQPYKEVETLGIQVSQPIRLELSEPTIPYDAMVGVPSDIEMEFFNMGKSPMYNMMVKLEGNFQVQGSNYFVGNFESGRSEYFAATIIPETEGEAVGKLIFEYEDALGNIEKLEQELNFFVANAGEMGNMDEFAEGDFTNEFPEGEFPGDEEKKPYDWKLILIVLVLGTVVGVVIYNKKRKAKLLAEMEDDDE